jgi:hypothetical protein
MKTNESNTDRIIRVVLGVALLVVGFGGFINGTLGLVFKIVGALLLLTGAVGFCPLYALLKFKTKKSK